LRTSIDAALIFWVVLRTDGLSLVMSASMSFRSDQNGTVNCCAPAWSLACISPLGSTTPD
jgi:hypothetical protein